MLFMGDVKATYHNELVRSTASKSVIINRTVIYAEIPDHRLMSEVVFVMARMLSVCWSDWYDISCADLQYMVITVD